MFERVLNTSFLKFQIEKSFPSRKPRSKLSGKILILLCISLILLLIVFLIGIERTSSTQSCRTVAAFLHYFILTTFMWMGVEAANLYQMFVKIFQTQTRSQKGFLIRASITAWGKQLYYNYFHFLSFCTVTLGPCNMAEQG